MEAAFILGIDYAYCHYSIQVGFAIDAWTY